MLESVETGRQERERDIQRLKKVPSYIALIVE
jgi:hypothetical protein